MEDVRALVHELSRLDDAALERVRLHAHFAVVLDELERQSPRGLSASRRAARSRCIAELRAYAAAGRFPHNPRFADFVPYFVDDAGTRCAVAHLVERSGGRELAARIARERNNAWLRELADEPDLLAW